MSCQTCTTVGAWLELLSLGAVVFPFFFFLGFAYYSFRFIYFMPMSVFPACMSVYQMSTWYPQRSDMGVRSLGTGFVDGCALLCGCWGSSKNS